MNWLLAVFANLPIGIPYAAFKKYHIEYHKFLSQDGIDTDLSSRIELILLNNVLGKIFYALRPTFVRVQTLTHWHLLNVGTQLLAFDCVLVKMFGIQHLVYLMSSFFAGSCIRVQDCQDISLQNIIFGTGYRKKPIAITVL
ncbi:hypothetical protein M378DRAFT_18395 [Amanita muscaria Koide BX008]|uniref:Uncharacterized protein n=1 Tax=Amanita muscaria (strain Koide BX008) TaxID=946122 RepID=A0A0C2W1F6_AMAMK|nr:hypothetical protein M378DRAFT_18395 [Amanita muscaria Koide BX008]